MVPANPIPPVIAESIEAPLGQTVDAASMLAADVNTAAEVLDNLKHLLRRQSPDSVPVSYLAAASTPAKLSWQPLPLMSAHAPTQVSVALLLSTERSP
jgi:hypothetical protein